MKQLAYRTLGNPAGNTVLFLHGWPDTDVLFEPQYKLLEKDSRIVTFSLPGFDPEDKKKAMNTKLDDVVRPAFFGYNLNDIVEMFKRGIDDAMNGRNEATAPQLIAHDWGAILSYELIHRYPETVSRFVALDIGQHAFRILQEGSRKEIIITLLYQWFLIFCFFLPNCMANPMLKKVGRDVFKVPEWDRIHNGMSYFYFRAWLNILTGTLPPVCSGKAPVLPRDFPLLFLRGSKGLRFYSKKFYQRCEEAGAPPRVIKGADHWFFRREKCQQEVHTEILKFLSKL